MKLEDLKKIREKAEKDIVLRDGKSRIKVTVGMGTSGTPPAPVKPQGFSGGD